jgi:hypothetical protein
MMELSAFSGQLSAKDYLTQRRQGAKAQEIFKKII